MTRSAVFSWQPRLTLLLLLILALAFGARSIVFMSQLFSAMPMLSTFTSWKPMDGDATSRTINTASVDEMERSVVNQNSFLPQRFKAGYDQNEVKGENKSPSATIVIELNGNMANQLCKLAYGYGLQWILQEDYGITSVRTILKHQDSSKWVGARKRVVTCFPRFREHDFSAGNTEEFKVRLEQQEMLLLNNAITTSASRARPTKGNLFHLVDCKTESCIRGSLDAFVQVLSNNKTNDVSNSTTATVTENNFTISLPFLRADTQGDYGYIIDRYYERLKDLFQFDYEHPDCCFKSQNTSEPLVAFPNETVFHLRAFWGELPRNDRLRWGFEELSANKTIHELFRPRYNIIQDSLAIVSRFPLRAKNFLKTPLEEAGWRNVRFIETDKGQQSFCFLLSAQHDLIGYSQSTFAVWAAYLGNATTSRLYSLKSPERIALYRDTNTDAGYFVRYNHSNPTLKQKMSYELYNSEEQDRIERGEPAVVSS